MTIAEALLPHVRLYRVARYIAEKHYVGGLHGPGAKEHVLARIYELAGDSERAEEYHTRAIDLRPNFADFHMFLGSFLARQRRVPAAISAFERALSLAQDQSTLASIEASIGELRRGTAS